MRFPSRAVRRTVAFFLIDAYHLGPHARVLGRDHQRWGRKAAAARSVGAGATVVQVVGRDQQVGSRLRRASNPEDVTVRAEGDGQDVVLRIRDTGIWISADVLPRIFDLFVQERQAIDRAQGGLGLGLTIVRNLVERHGGAVSAHSDGPCRGSEVTVRLPKASSP
jgi:light-regulated signal transduction histidine kinase (bacteriophytochrome)